MDNIDRAIGAAKETLGNVLNDENMKEKGHEENAKAIGEQKIKAQEEENKNRRDQAEAAGNKASAQVSGFGGAVKEGVGNILGNKEMKADGREQRAEGVGNSKLEGDKLDSHSKQFSSNDSQNK